MDDKVMATPTVRHRLVIKLFSKGLRVVWLIAMFALILAEALPRPLLSPIPFYSYQISKLLGFTLLGCLTPVSFWRFGSLGRCTFFGILSTAAIEAMQGMIEGHRFSFFELFVKLALAFVGFELGLLARYERRIQIGVVSIDFDDEHWHG